MYTKDDMDPKNTYTKYTHLGQITEKLVKLCEKKKGKRFGVACTVIVIPYKYNNKNNKKGKRKDIQSHILAKRLINYTYCVWFLCEYVYTVYALVLGSRVSSTLSHNCVAK